ncbi:MAG: zinc ribbon domain-containing protein [Rikenellaceae bacterium]
MKTCVKCNFENSDDSKFCEECGSQEFTPNEQSGEVIIGDNSAVSTGEIVSGGKNNTTNTTNTDNSTTTNISHGATAEDMASILKVVMQENSNIIKQVLEHQQQTQQSNQSNQTEQPQQSASAEAKGEAKPKDETKDEPNEYELVARNLFESIINVVGKIEHIGTPDKSYYLKRYHYILWIAATTFIFFMAAATAINALWIVLLASLGMVVYSIFKRFKGSGAEPKRELFDKLNDEYLSNRSTVTKTFGNDVEFLKVSDDHMTKLVSKFTDAEKKAAKDAKITTGVICGILLVVGYFIVSIAVG